MLAQRFTNFHYYYNYDIGPWLNMHFRCRVWQAKRTESASVFTENESRSVQQQKGGTQFVTSFLTHDMNKELPWAMGWKNLLILGAIHMWKYTSEKVRSTAVGTLLDSVSQGHLCSKRLYIETQHVKKWAVGQFVVSLFAVTMTWFVPWSICIVSPYHGKGDPCAHTVTLATRNNEKRKFLLIGLFPAILDNYILLCIITQWISLARSHARTHARTHAHTHTHRGARLWRSRTNLPCWFNAMAHLRDSGQRTSATNYLWTIAFHFNLARLNAGVIQVVSVAIGTLSTSSPHLHTAFPPSPHPQ